MKVLMTVKFYNESSISFEITAKSANWHIARGTT